MVPAAVSQRWLTGSIPIVTVNKGFGRTRRLGGGGTHRHLNTRVGSALLGAAFDTVAQVGESELLTDPVEFGFEDFAADNP